MPETKVASYSNSTKMVLQVPAMTFYDTVKLLRNCLTCLADRKSRRMHGDASRIKNAIYQEWSKRKRGVAPDEYFEWPSTDARGGSGNIDTRRWLQEGMLSFMGYHVGQSSDLGTEMRQALLGEIFQAVLPPVFPDDYLEQFGKPKSSQRLQKMAECIAAFARNAKCRGSKMQPAISKWERDLEFLYYKYYIEHFGFGWPST